MRKRERAKEVVHAAPVDDVDDGTYTIETYRPDLGRGVAVVDRATGKVIKFTPIGQEVKHGE